MRPDERLRGRARLSALPPEQAEVVGQVRSACAQPVKYGVSRRGFLQLSASGVVATSLAGWTQASSPTANDGFARAKSVLIVLLSGGPSQLDMLDPKPDAPAEVRGEFSTISTAIPGVAVCEHLPRLAQQLDRWSILRTMAHTEHNHLLATHVALTGRPTPLPRGGSDLDRVETRNDFPNFAAALDFVRPRRDGIPSGVTLPNYFIEGPLTWPGQHAGFLGPKHDPWQIHGDPNASDFRMHALAMREGITLDRVQQRRELLNTLTSGRSTTAEVEALRDQQQIAFNLLTSGKMKAICC